MLASAFLEKYSNTLRIESILISTPEWNDKDMYEFRFRVTCNQETDFFVMFLGRGFFPETRYGLRKKVAAKTEEFLELYANECQSYLGNSDMDDWLNEFGYPDNREAMDTYEAVRKNFNKWKKLLPWHMWKDFLSIREDE